MVTLPNTFGVGGLSADLWLNDDGTLTPWPEEPRQYLLFVAQGAGEGREALAGEVSSDRYLYLPERLDPAWLAAISRLVSDGSETPLEKARQIETYFKRHGRYTLDLKRA